MSEFQRTLIIGNAGAGKSTLAMALGLAIGAPVIGLDDVYWENAQTLRKRVAPAAIALITDSTAAPTWIIEGVFGWLIAPAVSRATALIWLDMPWEACKLGLAQRGAGASPSPDEYDALVDWASQYWTRTSSASWAGHDALFTAFDGKKVALRSRSDCVGFVAAMTLG